MEIIIHMKTFSNKLNIHEDIKTAFDYFINTNEVPNLLFHGQSGGGKRILVDDFINKLYTEKKKEYVMYIECGHGKGIKFIREEVNFFAKTNCSEVDFKTIILLNADKLTIDAQSALRRSIEMFCKTTRYIVIIQNKNKLINPLTSRFCEIFVPLPKINNEIINLHKYKQSKLFWTHSQKNNAIIKKKLNQLNEQTELSNELIFEIVDELYNKGVCGLQLIDYLVKTDIDSKFLLAANKMKTQINNERNLMLIILMSYSFRSKSSINNILSL